MKNTLIIAVATAGISCQLATASIISGAAVAYYSNPFAGKNISSYDWDGAGNLYWMEGDNNWAAETKVYKYNGSLSTIYSASAFAGTWVAHNDNHIYFDNGSEYAFYKYDVAGGGAPSQVFQQNNAWGYTFHNGGLYISGADGSWNNQLYYSALDASGNLAGPLVTLGQMGSPSGPITFDANGNLFYSAGYTDGKIYKYDAAEIAGAIAGTQLGDAALHEFIDFNSYGLDGATGMDFDDDGNLVASLTAFGSNSKLVEFDIDVSGAYLGTSSVLAESDGRMTTVRNYNGDIYVSDPDGIYQAVPEPGTVALMGVGFGCMAAFRKRRKYMIR
ncbi:PEP-CTERM sorting domain-containing protein [Pontiella sulfatireligans]|uniref:Ice-binding protein C-terminal domain-containing protein n=1 Tax=Pontiella sulfatireligans TaxID=2750658 RepID=A0A6C2UJS3_9BACT|nr:PEP-CTERM sorting domain-containing protein [Pontiella sulfatireligans]VGO20348.1 hypothetical protein SCARR_02411 [Pontiella sulfatireligans]